MQVQSLVENDKPLDLRQGFLAAAKVQPVEVSEVILEQASTSPSMVL